MDLNCDHCFPPLDLPSKGNCPLHDSNHSEEDDLSLPTSCSPRAHPDDGTLNEDEEKTSTDSDDHFYERYESPDDEDDSDLQELDELKRRKKDQDEEKRLELELYQEMNQSLDDSARKWHNDCRPEHIDRWYHRFQKYRYPIFHSPKECKAAFLTADTCPKRIWTEKDLHLEGKCPGHKYLDSCTPVIGYTLINGVPDRSTGKVVHHLHKFSKKRQENPVRTFMQDILSDNWNILPSIFQFAGLIK